MLKCPGERVAVIVAADPDRHWSNQVGSLLALTASGLRAAGLADTPAVRSLRELIQDCLRQRGTEWQLTAADIAASVNISVRTLHRVFAAAKRDVR